jgi:hypothetical protein
MRGKSCNRETSAKERMMVLLCEQELHEQICVDHGWKITEMTSKTSVKYYANKNTG